MDYILLKSILYLISLNLVESNGTDDKQASNDRRGPEGARKGGQVATPWRRLPRQFPTNCNFQKQIEYKRAVIRMPAAAAPAQ